MNSPWSVSWKADALSGAQPHRLSLQSAATCFGLWCFFKISTVSELEGMWLREMIPQTKGTRVLGGLYCSFTCIIPVLASALWIQVKGYVSGMGFFRQASEVVPICAQPCEIMSWLWSMSTTSSNSSILSRNHDSLFVLLRIVKTTKNYFFSEKSSIIRKTNIKHTKNLSCE